MALDLSNAPRDQSIGSLTLAYVVGFGLISGLVIGAHVIQRASIRAQFQSAEVVNVAGRQRMLTQRIAWSAEELSRSPASSVARARLDEAMKLLRTSHAALAEGRLRWAPNEPLADQLRRHYSEGRFSLDLQIAEFVAVAKRAARSNTASDAEQAARVLKQQAEGPLLADLNFAVTLAQRNGELIVARQELTATLLLSAVLILMLIEVLLIFRPAVRYFANQREELRELLHLAQTDSMTGCYNRRMLFEIAGRVLHSLDRQSRPASVLLLDIDHFKAVNDRYGHAAGDRVITRVVELILGRVRKSDIVGRLGGEEFAVFLPDTNPMQAVVLAESLRQLIEGEPIETTSNARLRVTVSIGVAALEAEPDPLIHALHRADVALYRAKHA
ncbi:MAG: diguanylate cyclase, partial [Pseudomonadota bacterium]